MRAFPEYQAYKDSCHTPLYSFGFGLSYSHFSYHRLTLNKTHYAIGEDIVLSVEVTNTSNVDGYEVVQGYIAQFGTSTTRPNRELKGFEKVWIKGGETKVVCLALSAKGLAFFGGYGRVEQEAGEIQIFVGNDSNATLSATCQVG